MLLRLQRNFMGDSGGRPLIGDGSFCEWLLVLTPDLLCKSAPEGPELNHCVMRALMEYAD
jgi:hypothetical protein